MMGCSFPCKGHRRHQAFDGQVRLVGVDNCYCDLENVVHLHVLGLTESGTVSIRDGFCGPSLFMNYSSCKAEE